MAVNFTRLKNEFTDSLVHAGMCPKGYWTHFLSPADAQELILDPANTPWVLDLTANVLSATVTMDAGAEAVTAFHDIEVPANWGIPDVGIQLVHYTVYYTVGVADLTSADFSLSLTTLPAATGSAPTAAAVSVTGTELLTQASHVVAMDVDAPAALDGMNEQLRLNLVWTMANTGTLAYYGTRCKFRLV